MASADHDLAPVELPALPRAGELVVGRYRLLGALDSGGMGCVFRAQDSRLGRPCALKFMRPELAAQPAARRRFEREARMAGQLSLENVVAVTDCGEHAGLPFVVMELLEGEDMRGLLRREQRLPLPRAIDIVVQACRGLHAVHAHGVVHRDLKPSNLFVTRHSDGLDLVKVLDFGVAKSSADARSGESTQTGTVMGTIQYMPPEQLRGEAVDARADVYALGAVLYEALAGRPPFAAREAHVLIHDILNRPLQPLRELRPELPDAVCAVVARALDRDPGARPASVDALARDLERALHVPVADAITAAPAALRAGSHAPAQLAVRAARGRSRRLAWAAAALLVATAAAWLLGTRGRAPRAGEAPNPSPPERAVVQVRDSAPPLPAPTQPQPQPRPQPPATTAAPRAAEPSAPPAAPSRKRGTARRRAERSDGLDIGEVFSE